VFWDNLTQGLNSVLAPAAGTFDNWDAAKLDGNPAISYQNLASAINLLYPLVIPAGAMRVNLGIEGGQVRIRTDGGVASATAGQRWSPERDRSERSATVSVRSYSRFHQRRVHLLTT
jgi:hypothetical protein